jgi:hypothetical protein
MCNTKIMSLLIGEVPSNFLVLFVSLPPSIALLGILVVDFVNKRLDPMVGFCCSTKMIGRFSERSSRTSKAMH